jgi:opacity protein-like surface antigen
LIIAVSVSIFATESFATQRVRTIYGMTSALHFHTKQSTVFGIQLGSFSKQSNATTLRNSLRLKTKLPVHVEQKNGCYAVMVGPLKTAEDVRNAARDLAHVQLKVSKKRSAMQGRPLVKQPVEHSFVKVAGEAPRRQVSSNYHPVFLKELPKLNLLARLMPTKKNWYASAGVGGQFPRLNSSMTVNNGSSFPTPFDQDIYSTTNNAQVFFGASVGRRWQNDNDWLPALSVGVLYEYFWANNLGGTITQFSIPQFNNYNYTWNTASHVVLASAKLNLFRYNWLSPYVNGGLGGAFNRASSYRELADPEVTARVSPSFAANTSNQFAYNAGVGVDFHCASQFFLSIGYLYQDLGKVTSGQGTQNWAGQSLNLGKYHSNDVMASVTYLFSH